MRPGTYFSIRSDIYRMLLGRKPLRQANPKLHDELFFSQGWGDSQVLSEIQNPAVISGPSPALDIKWTKKFFSADEYYIDGEFATPFFSNLLPPEVKNSRLRMFVPRGYTQSTPLCILFAMTGDEGFEYRAKTIARPLLAKGVATVLLENPYYGARRPRGQSGYTLGSVQDMLLMSTTAVEEGKALLQYFRARGHAHLGVAGVSQGAMVAAVVASKTPFPVAMACSLPAHAPDVILVEGLLSCFVDWLSLEKETGSLEASVARLREVFRIGDLTGLAAPLSTKSAFILGARRDFVAPRYSILKIQNAWPEVKMRWLPGTHLTSVALHSGAFRKVIVEAFAGLETP